MMAPAPTKLTTFELGRVSTNKQDLERQQYDLEDNREEFGLDPIKSYWIKESGEKVLSSEEWAEIESDLKQFRPACLSVSAVDRMARPQNMADFARFQIFADLKIAIASKREKFIEPWTPRGRKTLQQALFQAANELSDLKDRLASNRRKMHKRDKPQQTSPCYGILYRDKYSRDEKGECQYFYEDPEPSSIGTPKRDVVADVFHWRYDLGWRVGTIQTQLNRKGILSAGYWGKGGEWVPPGAWSRGTVAQMLKNKKYIGEHWESGQLLNCCRYEPFVARETFEGAQAMFAEAAKTSNGTPPTAHLLIGWMKCKHCGHNFRTTGGRYASYVCGHYDYKIKKQICRANTQIRCERIEEIVWRVIWRFLTQPELLLSNARAYYDSLPKPAGFAKLKKELAEITEEMENTVDMVRTRRMKREDGYPIIDAYQARIDEIERELRDAGIVTTLPEMQVLEAACREIATAEDELTEFDERRPVLEKLAGLRFTWDRGTMVIEGKVPVAVKAQKCNPRVNGGCSSVLYIPFKTKVSVEQDFSERTRKAWETRRRKKAA